MLHMAPRLAPSSIRCFIQMTHRQFPAIDFLSIQNTKIIISSIIDRFYTSLFSALYTHVSAHAGLFSLFP